MIFSSDVSFCLLPFFKGGGGRGGVRVRSAILKSGSIQYRESDNKHKLCLLYLDSSECNSACNEVSTIIQLPYTVVLDSFAIPDGEREGVLLTGAGADEEGTAVVAGEQ